MSVSTDVTITADVTFLLKIDTFSWMTFIAIHFSNMDVTPVRTLANSVCLFSQADTEDSVVCRRCLVIAC